MSRYIDADALIEEINSLSVTLCGKEIFGELAKHSVVQKINEAPTANVAPIADTVRKMHFEIQQRCIKRGIYPLLVGYTLDQVAYEITGDDYFKPRYMLECKE